MIAGVYRKLDGLLKRLLGFRQSTEPAKHVAAHRPCPAHRGSKRRFAPERTHFVSLGKNLVEAAELT